jgi:hypothetical protein
MPVGWWLSTLARHCFLLVGRPFEMDNNDRDAAFGDTQGGRARENRRLANSQLRTRTITHEAHTGDRLARHLMDEFADATGLLGGKPARRYLWTDAFAVCNFLGLHRQSGEGRYLDLALRLVDQVHHVLGRHRADDTRRGWIGGRSDSEGEQHPTRGGLRIGKPLPERRSRDPFDARLEWERDGQYFHYLTQWLHALERVHRETGQAIFHAWALELAQAAHAAFVRSDPAARTPRMVWKMSIDLDRVLVASTGQHDPLDAWISYLELRGAATESRPTIGPAVLGREIEEAAALCRGASWASEDPLGIGGLLIDAYRLAMILDHTGEAGEGVLRRIIAAAEGGLATYVRGEPLDEPASRRLAFRELGLAIGLHALERMLALASGSRGLPASLDHIARYRPLARRIDDFWSSDINRRDSTWRAHHDINAVMLATSLAPGGYLGAS